MKQLRRPFVLLVAVLTMVALLTGCAAMTPQQQRVLSGSAIGAGVGGLGAAALGGSVAGGAAIGAAAGAAGGLIVNEMKKKEHDY